MMKIIIKLILCLSLSDLLIIPEAFAGSCTDRIVNKCKSDGRAAGDDGGVELDGGSVDGMGSMKRGLTKKGAKMSAAGAKCKASAEQCESCPAGEKEECKKAVGDAAGNMEAQSAGMGDAGQMLGMIAGLAGAMLPLLMKKDEEEQQQQQQQDPREAMICSQKGCVIDCSKEFAFKYPACNDKLAQECRSQMSLGKCVMFGNRYCNAEGAGSPYCDTVVAYQFCSSGGRDLCPSCLQLQKESSPTCIDNPAACIAQNSAEETEKMRSRCPNDPVFGGGSAGFASGIGNPSLPTNPGAPPANPNLPPPILTAANPGGGVPTVPGGAGSGGTNGVPGGTVVQSVGGGSGSAQMGRDAYGNNRAAAVRNGGGGASGTGGMAAQSVGGGYGGTGSNGGGSFGSTHGGRDMASSSGGYRAQSSGPAPDVNGQFGPSLFATSSQVIRDRCQAGQFNHCP